MYIEKEVERIENNYIKKQTRNFYQGLEIEKRITVKKRYFLRTNKIDL